MFRDPLNVEKILAWADSYHEARGVWPTMTSGPVLGAKEIAWGSIDRYLRYGGRGLQGGTSLARLLAEKRGASQRRKRRLSVDQILFWADGHFAERGEWPTGLSGPVARAPGENWGRIDGALRVGCRGLPGGSSLRRILEENRALPGRTLTIEKIQAWRVAHFVQTGYWPSPSSGPIDGAPGETWSKIDAALRGGYRGLPGGSSLGRLFREMVD
jgi:hypothetical protein